MPELQDFDPEIYFGIAAETLLARFGARALFYAGEAQRKMRLIGDDDGFEMWTAIERRMVDRLRETCIPEGATIH